MNPIGIRKDDIVLNLAFILSRNFLVINLEQPREHISTTLPLLILIPVALHIFS